MSDQLPIQYMQNHKSGLQAIKLTEEPYKGIMYTYGKVSFKERDDGNMTCNFEYNIIDDCGKEVDMKKFENYISRILQELLKEGVKDNSLIYTGGVDENRTEDSDESDSR